MDTEILVLHLQDLKFESSQGNRDMKCQYACD